MARKTTTPELIESTPKVKTLTEEQFKTLKNIATELMNIRRTLEDLEGQEEISTIMFNVGRAYNTANTTETILDNLLEQYEEECDECDENY
jgi:vacuolar-type H+-ATPase subunit E/Vma4